MVFIGDYFAIGLVIILSLFYYDGKTRPKYMPSNNKYFIACLIFTALTALLDIVAGILLEAYGIPLWINMAVNTLYFIINIIATSSIAFFLFTKMLEHTYDNHCMKNARTALIILFCIYSSLVIANIWTGWLFYFDVAGSYHRGPLNVAGYIITVLQMVLVVYCYIRNRKVASRAMRRVLLYMFPVVVLCIILQRIIPSIMLNGLIMAMVDTILFLTFQGNRQGIHSLTQLNDRHRFFREVERRLSHEEYFRIYLINLKQFGTVNKKYGHMFGDEALYRFAFSLENLFRDAIPFHMNGTVFALILPDMNEAAAEKRTGALLNFLDSGIDCMNEHVDIDYVVTEALVTDFSTSAGNLYENLEFAASNAFKSNLRYMRFTEDIGHDLSRMRHIIERFKVIDRSHGYEVWYQPIKCLATGEFCSMEALIRLREPDGSLISPAEFIPLAESTGNISPITWFVIEEVCDLLNKERALDNVSVSINLPMAQLLDNGFVTRLNSIVDRAGIAHRRICLEFTERAILDTFEKTKEIMDALTADGYRFFLDDFGAGYSNFNCLMHLPFKIIKLDACIVHSACSGKDHAHTADTLTHLFHGMGLEVIAEGAETEEDVKILTECGVDRIQGYAFARPMPAARLIEFLKK